MKKLVSFLLIVLLCCAAVAGLSACKEANTETKFVGFDVELAGKVGDYLGIDIKFESIEWRNKQFALGNGDIDAVWNGMTITEDRQSSMLVSVPYLTNSQVAVIRKEDKDKYSSLDDIKSAMVAVQADSAGYYMLAENGFSESKISQMETQLGVFTQLTTKGAEVGLVDSIFANYYLNEASQNGDSAYTSRLTVVDIPFENNSELIGIGLRVRDFALADKINSALAALYEDGTILELANKYNLQDNLLPIEYTSIWDEISDKSSWDDIQNKGELVIGYTKYAPMAFDVLIKI